MILSRADRARSTGKGPAARKLKQGTSDRSEAQSVAVHPLFVNLFSAACGTVIGAGADISLT